MDLFKFTYATDPTILERGEAINNALSIMWVERYREPGEFEISGKLSSGLREFLPLGTLISHGDTYEVMIVENHEIKDKTGTDPDISITGRSLDSYLENRIVGTNQTRTNNLYVPYTLTADYTWNQLVKIINDHILNTSNANDAFGNIVATTNVTGISISTAREIKRDRLDRQVAQLLEIDDLGIKTIRRSTFPGGNNIQTQFLIYRGVNKSASIIFSWQGGDLKTADYLWSDKTSKTSALVIGRYVNVMVDTVPTKFNRRTMLVDANDIDGNLSAPPAGAALTDIVNKMTVRGNAAIMGQNRLTITRADISDITQYEYRRDYNIGDLVTLNGNFGQIAVMRVMEYVEIEDETGESGHPTLAVPDITGSGFREVAGD